MHAARGRLLAGLLLLCSQCAVAKEAWERDWIEVRSPHFTVISALPEPRTIELLTDLENFRRAVELITNMQRFHERIPTRIYMLPNKENDFHITGDVAGYMLAGMRGNYAAMVPSGAFTDEVLKHEYVHFLVHNRGGQQYPTWFDEGFAELLSTLSVTNTTLEYGKANSGRVSWLINGDWMPFRKLLSVRDTSQLRSDQRSMFYAQAWYLTHYLNIGDGAKTFVAQSGEYLRLVEAGTPSPDAFATAFGISPDRLETKLRAYARRIPLMRIQLPTPFPAVAMKTVRMSADAVAADLGLLALQTAGAVAAEKYFDAALAANPNNAQALVGLGDVRKMTGRAGAAKPFYERAIALAPDNANHHLDYGEYFLDLATAETSPDKVPALLDEARRHFFRSHKLDPDNPETLAMNGASYLYAGEDVAKAVSSLETAHNLLPAQADIRRLLARAYIAAGQKADARKQLTQLLAWSHSTGVPELEAMLRALDADAADPADTQTSESRQQRP